jgi:hypothetical protein
LSAPASFLAWVVHRGRGAVPFLLSWEGVNGWHGNTRLGGRRRHLASWRAAVELV